jgi:hypothetical protein
MNCLIRYCKIPYNCTAKLSKYETIQANFFDYYRRYLIREQLQRKKQYAEQQLHCCSKSFGG